MPGNRPEPLLRRLSAVRLPPDFAAAACVLLGALIGCALVLACLAVLGALT